MNYLLGVAFALVLLSSNLIKAQDANPDSQREEQNGKTYEDKHNSATKPYQRASVTTQHNASCNRKEDGDRVQSDEDQRWVWPPTPEWAAICVASVSAVATLIYALISYWQWTTLRAQNRPWIMVTPDLPQGWPSGSMPTVPFQFKWSAKNVGKSPAFLTQVWTHVFSASFSTALLIIATRSTSII